MRKLSFILLTFFLTAISFVSYSQDKTSTITVTKMGTLGTTINDTEKKIITKLILKGEINADDFEVMKTQMPNLKHLDLKDVTCENDEIPNRAFGGSSTAIAHQNIESIVFPLSIKKIGAVAFRNCRNLTGPIILPEGLTHIAAHAFYSSGLTGSLVIPAEVIQIGDHAFRNCNFNGTLTFAGDEKLTTIGRNAFQDCSGFTGPLIFPTGGKITIGVAAFNGCSGFTNPLTDPLIIPDNVELIRNSAFIGCSGIEAIEFRRTKYIFGYGKIQAAADFERTYDEGVIIRVPQALVDDYKADPGWNEFHNGKIVGF